MKHLVIWSKIRSREFELDILETPFLFVTLIQPYELVRNLFIFYNEKVK